MRNRFKIVAMQDRCTVRICSKPSDLMIRNKKQKTIFSWNLRWTWKTVNNIVPWCLGTDSVYWWSCYQTTPTLKKDRNEWEKINKEWDLLFEVLDLNECKGTFPWNTGINNTCFTLVTTNNWGLSHVSWCSIQWNTSVDIKFMLILLYTFMFLSNKMLSERK